MQQKDYYQVLGISRSATDKEIKAAYRKLARQYHPDLNPGDPKAETKFQEINEAHEVLSDSEKRQQYDRFGANWKHAQPTGAGEGFGGGQPFDFDFSNLDFSSAGGASDIFEQMFGRGGGRRRSSPSKGANTRADVELTLEEAFAGTSKTVPITSQIPCPNCRGGGVGRGGLCGTCAGSGRRSHTQTLEIKIPAGVNEGAKIKYQGKGQPGEMGGNAGDLYLTIHLKRHPDYEIKGRDLYRKETISLFTAVLGGILEVQTLKGKIDLKIPPGTQGGRKFRIGGFGLPGSSGKPSGNLYVEIQIAIPEQLTEEQREQFRVLAKEITNETFPKT